MKRTITTLIVLTIALNAAMAQIKITDNSLKKSDVSINTTWPEYDVDGNENPQQILLRVLYDKFPQGEIEKLSFNTSPTLPNSKSQVRGDGKVVETHLYLPLNTEVVSITHPQYGVARLNLPPNLSDKEIYQAQLSFDSKVNVDVEPYTDGGTGITVMLDNTESKTTPARFYDVSVGSHKVDFNINGRHVTRIIEVTPQNHIFTGENPDFDLRTKKTVTITTDKPGAKIYIDGVVQAQTSPLTQDIPYGIHTIKAERDKNVKDEITLTIDNNTHETITLRPREKVVFKISGRYKGYPVVGDLYVDGDKAYKYTIEGQEGLQDEYSFEMPVGQKHSYKMTHRGNEGNLKIKAMRGMPTHNYIEIKDRKKFTWPWERPYETSVLSVSAGYVQKRMVTTAEYEGEKDVYKEDGVWDNREGHWLHGMQFGLQYQPAFWWGLGLYSGLFYEFYWSDNPKGQDDEYYDSETGILYYAQSKYNEHSMYMPVHLYYRIPLAERFSIGFSGGLGMSYVLKAQYFGKKGEFAGMEGEYAPHDSFHGDMLYPQKFNLTLECGVRIRFGAFMVIGQLGWGLNDHKSYRHMKDIYPGISVKTVVDHNSLSLSYLF